MTAVADDEPPSIADLTSFQEKGRAWVIANDEGEPVAYLPYLLPGSGGVSRSRSACRVLSRLLRVSNCDFTARRSRTITIKIKQQIAMNTDAPTTSAMMI
jgi:hypothetical protein